MTTTATTTSAGYATELRLLIGGASVGAGARATIPVLDPATSEEIGQLPVATDADLRDALASAQRGFARWRATSAYDRAVVLRNAARLIRERVETIARVMTIEQGKPLAESRAEVLASADVIEWTGEEGRRAYGRVVPPRAESVRQLVLREPVGPVAAFTPWNFPAITPARKLAGALGAGCSLIIKPSEETPATALALVDALRDAGLPDDVVNVVFGDPPHISETLLASPVIRKISFTGSTAVGKHLARLAADGVKRATLELGGHAPVIVSDRADLDKAVKASVSAKFRNAGQVCVSPSRFLVQERVAPAFTEAFAAAAAALRVGPGVEETTQMGSLANARRRDAIHALVEDATQRGGTLHTGGAALDGPGFFYAPTVVGDVPADARVLSEEPFGPIAVITSYRTLDEAIAQANALPYGLAAYAFTQDVGESIALGNRIEAGMVGINHFGVSLAEIPFGGVKESGYGSEGGTEGIDGYLVTKSVTTAS
ncbi:MAG: NAD-dependent succinate-semialdehyde dehydrogenase [Candidatus Eremiobacteraeota bacterium]|nr:NAD-dependent succinate-semialdehyde dehydrogenase [Candidatus Eremiobacteraeota bacterium]